MLAAAAYTSEDLEYVVDQHWTKNDDKEDIVKLILESIEPRYHEAYKKRVKNMLVQTTDVTDIPDNFIWLNMYQLKELLKMDNIMNPHLRSIISYL